MGGSHSSEVVVTLKPGSAVLSCDISHLHPALGRIVQTFKQEDDSFPYMGEQTLFISAFAIFPADGAEPKNFSCLGREVTTRIWQEVFSLKNLYLERQIPDVIQHIVKHPFSIERRFELYKANLLLSHYDIWHSNTSIWLERKMN